MRFENTAGTLGATRFAVYFDDQAAVAQVTLKVTAGDGVTVKEYHVALRRRYISAGSFRYQGSADRPGPCTGFF